MDLVGMFAGLVAVVALIVASLMFAGVAVSKHYDRVACERFEQEANRETRFILYHHFQWDCLTPSGDGTWISTSRLRDFGETP